MLFELINAFATFQNYIHSIFKKYLNIFVIAYFDDILIFFQFVDEHVSQIKFVLKKLKKFRLYAKLKKCFFHVTKIDFLSFLINNNEIKMNFFKIKCIMNWPEFKIHRKMQIFLNFVNFYRRFVKEYFRIVFALIAFFVEKIKKFYNMKFQFSKKIKTAFETLKKTFSNVFMLVHFDFKLKIQLKTDAFDFAISKIIFQLIKKIDQWHLIVFWSRKMTFAKKNYETNEFEMLIIINCCKQWKQYLKNVAHNVRIIIDYCNFRIFFINKFLNKKKIK